MSNIPKTPPRLGTIEAACRLVGGDQPIHASTYYRGAKAGIYPEPKKVAPNVSRVDMDKLADALRSRLDGGEAA